MAAFTHEAELRSVQKARWWESTNSRPPAGDTDALAGASGVTGSSGFTPLSDRTIQMFGQMRVVAVSYVDKLTMKL